MRYDNGVVWLKRPRGHACWADELAAMNAEIRRTGCTLGAPGACNCHGGAECRLRRDTSVVAARLDRAVAPGRSGVV